MSDETSPLDAAIVELAALSAKVTAIDNGLAEIRRAILQIRAASASEHEILRNIDGLDLKVAEIDDRLRNLAGRFNSEGSGSEEPEYEDYVPAPTVRWWQIEEVERAEAITRLKYWVSKIFVPGYGYLSKLLPACWPQHELALYTLSWLSELWSVLYLRDEPTASTLAAMAELQTRLLPAAVDQMSSEASNCGHGDAR